MRVATLFLCAVAAVLMGAAQAQQTARLNTLSHQSWSTEQGLPQDSVHAIVQDQTGFLWLATEGGLVRFDGVAFRVFGRQSEAAFLSDDISCLAVDAAGAVWAGTADGLMQQRGDGFVRLGKVQGLPSAEIRALVAEANGALLVLTDAGLVRWTRGRFAAVAGVPQSVDGMFAAQGGGAWLLAGGQALLLKDGRLEAVPLVLPAKTDALAGAPGATVWTSTATSVTRLQAGRAEQWQVGRELGGSRVESLYVDRSGDAWVGTNDGVDVLGPQGREVVSVAALRGNTVLGTFQDREGSFWLGTEATGLHQLHALPIRPDAATLNKALPAIQQSSTGAVWFGTPRDGLLVQKGELLVAPVAASALTSPLILALAAGEDGSMWAGTPDGLNHVWADGRVQRFTSADGLPDDYVQALASDAGACVWAGTRQGLAHVCGSHVDAASGVDGLADDVVGTLLRTRSGALWIGTSSGLSRRAPDGRMVTLTQKDGLPAGTVSAVAEDLEGQLWVATRKVGLSRVTAGGVQRVPGRLFAADVLGMVADREGSLWLRRERGLDQVRVADLDQCVEVRADCAARVKHYGTADGLPSDEMTLLGAPGLVLMRDGAVWVATRRGVGIVTPGEIARNLAVPGTVIESFLLDDVPVPMATEPMRIPFGARRLTIEYAGLSFVVPSEVRYRYKLDGFDSHWTEAGGRRSATYTNLPPGRYVFRVQACNNDGVWNEQGASLHFRILPPFYRRWWFVLLVAVLLLALAGTLYRMRLRRIQGRFEAVLQERNRMAREIHDTLAQDFVALSLQLDIVSQFLGMRKAEEAAEQVQQARQLVTEGLAEARRSIWELRANTATDSLPTRLAKLADRYAKEGTELETSIGGAYRVLDPRTETELLRIAQEALSNVQRHAEAKHASLSLHYGARELVMTVEDDGQGFDVEEALRRDERYGLNGLKERAALLGGSLEIRSVRGEGSRITLTAGVAPARRQAE